MTMQEGTSAHNAEPRELYARHALKNGRAVVTMRALDYDDACVVDVHLGAAENLGAHAAHAYRFGDAGQATSFVTEAVEALIYLGCEIRE
jgi:2-methylcitrate dehydratase PrpD